MMTRKHYIAFADALHYVKPTLPVCPPKEHKLALHYMRKQWTDCVLEVMSVLQSDNPRFDKGQFMDWVENGNPSEAKLAAIKARAIDALVDRDRNV
jgi:hypothetical protein